MFPPAASRSHHGTVVEGEKTQASVLHQLLSYMTRLLRDGRGHSSWPRLDAIRFVFDAV